MASLDGFNANEVEASEPMGPVPAATYIATIIDSERKSNKAGTGEYLLVKFAIQDGDYTGRKITNFLNLWNANDMAKEIAWRDMAAICLAVGIPQPNDSTDIHGIPLEIVVGVRDPDEQGRVFNDIKGYQKRTMKAVNTEAQPGNAAWMK